MEAGSVAFALRVGMRLSARMLALRTQAAQILGPIRPLTLESVREERRPRRCVLATLDAGLRLPGHLDSPLRPIARPRATFCIAAQIVDVKFQTSPAGQSIWPPSLRGTGIGRRS
jgi:hypothetical protein